MHIHTLAARIDLIQTSSMWIGKECWTCADFSHICQTIWRRDKWGICVFLAVVLLLLMFYRNNMTRNWYSTRLNVYVWKPNIIENYFIRAIIQCTSKVNKLLRFKLCHYNFMCADKRQQRYVFYFRLFYFSPQFRFVFGLRVCVCAKLARNLSVD